MDATIVFHAADGVVAHRDAIDGYVQQAKAIGGVGEVTSPFDQPSRISADGTTTFIRVDIDRERIGADDDPTGALRERAAAMQGTGVGVAFLGDGFSNGGPPASEMFGILAAMFILLIAFGSVVAMGLPIVTAIVGIVIGLGRRRRCWSQRRADARLHRPGGVDDRHRRGHRLRAVHRHPLPRGAADAGSAPRRRRRGDRHGRSGRRVRRLHRR